MIIIILFICNSFAIINKGVGWDKLIRIKSEIINNKVEEIELYVSEVISGDTYKCQYIHSNKIIPEKFIIIKIENVSCNNILSEESKKYVVEQITGKSTNVKIRNWNNDTIIGDIEYNQSVSNKKTSISQIIIQNGFSPYLREFENKALELLEEKAIENNRGIWEKLDPIWIKKIQDSIKEKNQKSLDSLLQEFEIQEKQKSNFLIL